ncbi:serine hydrolase domain-containing protein [Saccharothrix sp. NRRL B-16348]|uniref:serine hydrolase domain-containing protein n=1 Tax=Saccharothrix sp. NRRL B-16348 TaxID=1415542 RepID=UPI0006AE8C26|nr:serine hydrolase domain-containing protein [Saccharothrix sp. NRRL B-16348]
MDIDRRRVLAGLALLPAALAAAGEGRAQAGPDTSARRRPPSDGVWESFGEHLAREAGAGRFSGVVVVAHHDRPLLHRAYGMADTAGRVANTPATRCTTGSVTKTFTAVAVAQLVERRKLSFHEPIGTYVPEFPAGIGERVTLHHLLTHTSGMGDALAGPGGPPPIELEDLLALIVGKPLLFEPGSRPQYSNDGFTVLGAIVQRVADRPYRDHLREHVFEPAGMCDTGLRTFRPVDVPGMAHGHMLVDENGRWIPPGPGDVPPGATLVQIGERLVVGLPGGGAYSTAADLLAFATALTGHRLLGPRMTRTLTTGTVPSGGAGGPGTTYGYGIEDRRVNGVRVLSKNGASAGFMAQLDIYPGTGHVVVFLTNQDRVMMAARRRAEDILTGSAT